jgi:3-oxoacyl-[acyl-carrier-protein] synthase II
VNRQVVVTGMAAWTPFGRGLGAFWDGITGTTHGVREIERLDVSDWAYRSRVAANVEEISGDNNGEAEIAASRIMLAVADDVLSAAHYENDLTPDNKIGLCVGASQSATNVQFQSFIRAQRGEGPITEVPVSDTWISSASILRDLSSRLKARGPAAMISTACTSSTTSVGVACGWITSGRAKRAFAGGLGYFSQLSSSGFNILRLTGKTGCKPFDKRRDGMMLGDGFALLALEDGREATKRGANILAKVVGHSSANEAYHPTSPDPEGASGERVMWAALQQSGDLLHRLDYVNAHGTGTVANDAAELRAIERLLARRNGGCDSVLVSSTKGAHGHCLGGAGSIELVATILAGLKGVAPPNLNLEDPEVVSHNIELVRVPTPREIRVAVSNSFAFGGNVASIAVGFGTEF